MRGVWVYVGLPLVKHVEIDPDGAEEGHADDHGVAHSAPRVARLQVAVGTVPGVVVVVRLERREIDLRPYVRMHHCGFRHLT